MEGKKRTTNFTPDEKRILSELVLKYRDTVENKKTDAATNNQKINAWIRLANEFNSISSFCHRNHQSLKTCWDNIKRQTKKDKANIKKEIFKTGGGLPPPIQENRMDSIVEAVLGPAVAGIPNCHDSDRTTNNIIELEVNHNNTLSFSVLPSEYNSQIEQPNTPSAARVIICDDVTKENMVQSNQSQVDTPPAIDIDYSQWSESTAKRNEEQPNTPSTLRAIIFKDNTEGNVVPNHSKVDAPTSVIDYSKWPASTSISNDMDSSTDWTPKTLKRPLADCLRTVNRYNNKSVRRRRPVNENLQDEILREKLSLVKLLKQKAEEEADIRILILREQLKQQFIIKENYNIR